MRIAWMVAVVLGVGVGARADVLCQSKKGALALRPTCKKKETAVPPSTFGGAVAWAHVAHDGTVDAARSRGITGADVSLQSTSAYCFHDLSFPVGNAVVTADYADFDTGTQAAASYAIGDPYGDCSDQAGTRAEVAMSVDDAYHAAGFFIVFH